MLAFSSRAARMGLPAIPDSHVFPAGMWRWAQLPLRRPESGDSVLAAANRRTSGLSGLGEGTGRGLVGERRCEGVAHRACSRFYGGECGEGTRTPWSGIPVGRNVTSRGGRSSARRCGRACGRTRRCVRVRRRCDRGRFHSRFRGRCLRESARGISRVGAAVREATGPP